MIKALLFLLAAAVAASYWWRRNPSPCPFAHRWVLKIPRPVISRQRLIEILELEKDASVLEIGPGPGFYALHVVEYLSDGKLDLLDIQEEMLDYLGAEAVGKGFSNFKATLASAEEMPYPDNRFDAVYLVTVLGEVPEPDRAISEIVRVLKPGGRVVFGEIFGDPHMVTLAKLQQLASEAGLQFDRIAGNRLAFFARFNKSS